MPSVPKKISIKFNETELVSLAGVTAAPGVVRMREHINTRAKKN